MTVRQLTNGRDAAMDDETMFECQRCGGPVDPVDGWTDGSGALCGGMYGRGCDRSAWVWPAVAVLSAAHPGFLWAGGEDVDGWQTHRPDADRVIGVWRDVAADDGTVGDVWVSIGWDAVDGSFSVAVLHGEDPSYVVRRHDWMDAALGEGAEWHVGVLPDAVRFGVADARRIVAVAS